MRRLTIAAPFNLDSLASTTDCGGVVEPLCAVLSEHGVPISPSMYYEWVLKHASRRALRDEQVATLIMAERAGSRLVAGLGSRKMWLLLHGQGRDVTPVHCGAAVPCARLGRSPLRAQAANHSPDDAAGRPADLVDRNFAPAAPNQLWVADFVRPGGGGRCSSLRSLSLHAGALPEPVAA